MVGSILTTFFRLALWEQGIVLVGIFILLVLTGLYPSQAGAAVGVIAVLVKLLTGK